MFDIHTFGRVLGEEERALRGSILFDGDPGLTEQSHRDACDINVIMRNYDKTGVVPVMSSAVPRHGDFMDAVDYQTACNMMIEAQSGFMALPANIRQEYGHDPQLFLTALENPQERARLVRLGVFVDEVVPQAGVEIGEPGKARIGSEGAKEA